ncbi:MAG TPA: O-antigen ligase family protein [Candidatus Binatia bacterium]|nr:O-antigen ligase family protein [Candidatus Binatia bacterium]
MNSKIVTVVLALGLLGVCVLVYFVDRRPFLFANATYLGGIIALQIALAGLSRYEEMYFPLLMGTFLWAGSSLPLTGAAMSLRWLFLGVGGFGGFVYWIKTPRARHFSALHLVSIFCVVAALVSAIVSETPRTSLLKVGSLLLLFLYASAGARLAVAGREARFFDRLVLVCEILVYFSAACYYALGFHVFGNPNALGAIISVAAVPVLFWAAVIAEGRNLRQRRFFALLLCALLLYSANSRASVLSAIAVVLIFTIAIRHQKLLVQVAFVSVFGIAVIAVFNPSRLDEMTSAFTGRFLLKESGTHHGLFGSRLSPWNDTMQVVKRHPWFGSGFGTSELGQYRPDVEVSSIYTTEGTNREHGDSYLALAEYMGLLGSLPFVILLLMVLRLIVRTCRWMRATASPYNYAVPLCLIVIAGLVHACFEDWLFAVGSYLCLFFWVAAFLLADLVPTVNPQRSVWSTRPLYDRASPQASTQVAAAQAVTALAKGS